MTVRPLLLSTALSAALLAGTPALASSPSHPGAVHAAPMKAPPPARVENPAPRRGQVFIPGHYEWRRGAYRWVAGHWERERKGQQWVPGRWEPQGRRHVWVAGYWQEVPAHPRTPPPPARKEHVEPRSGHVWVAGHWEWSRSGWAWVPGHWERERPGHRWQQGRWERSGERYVWHAGSWHR